MKRAAILILLILGVGVFAQTISYFNSGFLRQPNAVMDRDYLGVTNFTAGTNILFTHPSPLVYQINLSGGSPMPPASGVWYTDGTNIWWTNSIPGQVQIGDGSTMKVKLSTDGQGVFESNLTSKAKLASQTLEVSSTSAFGDLMRIRGGGVQLTNCSLLVTGAQYIALSNGAAYVLFTNGTLTVSAGITLNSGNALIGGAIRANSDSAIFWWNRALLYSPSVTQVNLSKSGTTGPTGDLACSNVVAGANITATNRISATNFIGGTSVNEPNIPGGQSPLGSWGFLGAYGTGPFVPATVVANTYYQLTNWVCGWTNNWVLHLTKTNGVLKNVAAGWYRIGFSVSGYGNTGNELEADIMTNNVNTDCIAAHWTTATAAKSACGKGEGILYLPAGTDVSVSVKNIDSTALTITHAQLTVGTP